MAEFFSNKPLKWNNNGMEPTEELKVKGWQVGDKPPAEYFNYKFNSDYKAIDEIQSKVKTHNTDKNNPHNINKSQIGLSNVDNTSDKNKPISTSVQNALNTKADNTTLQAHTNNRSNPHNINKSQIGLSNVDNTSDKNKPISTSVENALNNKADISADYGLEFKNITYDITPDNTYYYHCALNAKCIGEKPMLYLYKHDDTEAVVDSETSMIYHTNFKPTPKDIGAATKKELEAEIKKRELEDEAIVANIQGIHNDYATKEELEAEIKKRELADKNIDYLGSLIDKNTVEGTQNYIKFGNNIALLWGRVHEICTENVEYVNFPEELNISTVLNIQICNKYSVQNLGTDDINKRTKLFGEPSSKGFSYINYIINECVFYWFAIVLIE